MLSPEFIQGAPVLDIDGKHLGFFVGFTSPANIIYLDFKGWFVSEGIESVKLDMRNKPEVMDDMRAQAIEKEKQKFSFVASWLCDPEGGPVYPVVTDEKNCPVGFTFQTLLHKKTKLTVEFLD